MVDEAVHNHVEEWAGCVQPVHVDNAASFHAFRKGRSRNKRMNEMHEGPKWFQPALQAVHHCVCNGAEAMLNPMISVNHGISRRF